MKQQTQLKYYFSITKPLSEPQVLSAMTLQVHIFYLSFYLVCPIPSTRKTNRRVLEEEQNEKLIAL